MISLLASPTFLLKDAFTFSSDLPLFLLFSPLLSTLWARLWSQSASCCHLDKKLARCLHFSLLRLMISLVLFKSVFIVARTVGGILFRYPWLQLKPHIPQLLASWINSHPAIPCWKLKGRPIIINSVKCWHGRRWNRHSLATCLGFILC